MSSLRLRKRAKRTSAGGALMADLVRHRVAVIATPGSSGSGLSQLADQFIPTSPWKRVL
jgi:hypothetical protein